jgi:hypothetical protein
LASFEEAVVNGDLTHAENYRLTEHVLNARRNPTRRAGLPISKEYPDSPNKIDCAVAAGLRGRLVSTPLPRVSRKRPSAVAGSS